MLTQLTIHNFAIVEHLELDFQHGMTAISGETGAGKSIMIDALGLTLGNRAESGSVRPGSERADMTASFDLSALPHARQWLAEREFDRETECLLRRVISSSGRSKAYINGQPAPLQSLRELGEHLIDIHGQHEHQRLLKKEHHRQLLDSCGGITAQAQSVNQAFNHWQQLSRRLHQINEQSETQSARIQLLSYQVQELNLLNPEPGELGQLETEQQELANADGLLRSGDELLQIACEGEQESCTTLLNRCLQLLGEMGTDNKSLNDTQELFNNALIHVEEACRELRQYLTHIEINPQRLQEAEERLSALYQIARKHQISATELPNLHRRLSEELGSYALTDEALEQLQSEHDSAQQDYQSAANQLSEQRRTAALLLDQQVDEQLHDLGMPSCRFMTLLSPLELSAASRHGLEEIEFLIITNPGQPPKPLGKIASGGELSRISLAVQVVTVQSSNTPTLIFDEVDVGIGGAIAEVVGKLLRQLGKGSQVLCVTHQPQVASCGHQHLFVSKQNQGEQTQTHIQLLGGEQRVAEIARMLGGIDITQRSLDHAQEMLALD